MRRWGFRVRQLVEILKQGESGVPIAELIRKQGISRPTYFNWRTKYGGGGVSELSRLKGFETDPTPALRGRIAPRNRRRLLGSAGLETSCSVAAHSFCACDLPARQTGSGGGLLDCLVSAKRFPLGRFVSSGIHWARLLGMLGQGSSEKTTLCKPCRS
jgi:putative transposase